MHFITENELRTIYRKAPFHEFSLKSGERLTPEGKQFLTDKKVNLILEETGEKTLRSVELVPEFLFYKNWLSCELYEAAILAMEHSVAMSQELLMLGEAINETLGKAADEQKQDCGEPVFESPAFELEAVHLFSRHGKLFIKLKKIDAFIHLFYAKYPHCQTVLQTGAKKVDELSKQLVGVGQ